MVPTNALDAACVGLAVLCSFLLIRNWRKRSQSRSNPSGLPYPPGPKPLPIVGNLFDLAREKESEAYLKLAHQYGNLVFLSVMGKNVLFVNSFQTANELFEKRSANYSDRSESPMINDLMGWDWSFGHMRYGERWRIHRRMFHRQFQQSIAHIHWPTQLKEAHSLIRRLLHAPDELIDHFRHNAASVIMNVTYGINVAPHDDRYITIAEKALDGMAKAANPGAFLVDVLPFLKHVPAWMPGAGFQLKAREWRKAVTEMRDLPFEAVRNALKTGTASPCFVANLVNDLELKEHVSPQDMDTIKGCAGLAYAAGAESTVSSLASFVLAVIVHPEVQVRAQEELDRVIGRGRLPDFNDRGSLPYINAVVKEVLRWNPVAPLGLPHMVTTDDEYNGYFIPAGTIVIGNSWAILHDPSTYPEPSRFNPDRWMEKGKTGHDISPTDPLSSAFGYGRRMCPGRFMAEAQLWISIACMFTTFNIGPGLDESGKLVETIPEFASGMICHPVPYKYSITPRGEYVKPLIEQTVDLHP
ncbi:cytochrome P450 [Infundibulicybe gibba]|nr:cytochrome P450 [Infundibulicybe gibba]